MPTGEVVSTGWQVLSAESGSIPAARVLQPRGTAAPRACCTQVAHGLRTVTLGGAEDRRPKGKMQLGGSKAGGQRVYYPKLGAKIEIPA